MALSDLIKLNKHRPVRKLYIKRRATADASYEGSWVRIDNWQGQNRVIDFGSASQNIDEQPGVVAAFEVSECSVVVDNNDGFFNVETYENSIWYPETTYLNRRYTKLKIETHYLDEDDAEVATGSDFEGLIDSIIIAEDGTATINALSYQSVFTRYPIQDLSLTGSGTASSVVTSICNQSKITVYMPYVAPNLGVDYTISDKALLEGTYWDILQEIAFKSDSTIVLENDTFKLVPRTGGSVAWNFKGAGSDESADVISIVDYDDEGIGKVRVYWKEEDGATFAKSSDATLLLKYLSEPEIVNLDNIDSGDKQDILNALLSKWESNRPSIQFECKYIPLSLLDKITLEVRGRVSPGVGGGGFRWSSWTWDDGSVWGKEIGGIIIGSGTEWFITQIIKDFQNWKMTIRAEKVT